MIDFFSPFFFLTKTGTPGGGAGSSDATLFVKGFDKYMGEDEVRNQLTEAFAAFGEVKNIRLPTDRETGELKGFGYVEFGDASQKNAAAELDGAEAAGGWLKVDVNSQSTPGGGGGRGGGFSGGRGGGRDGGGRFGGGGRFSGGRGGRDGGRGRGGRDGGRGGGGRFGGRGDFKPRMSIDANAGSGKKMTFDD